METSEDEGACEMLSRLKSWTAERVVEAQQPALKSQKSPSTSIRLVGGTGAYSSSEGFLSRLVGHASCQTILWIFWLV